MTMLHRNLTALTIVAASGLAAPAVAQNALGDGRALDANLSTQGRINNQVKDTAAQIRFSQRVVEGQAGGGRSFRGDLGYRATDDFAGTLSSDQLYSFRRDSSSSAAAGVPGLRMSDALRYQFGLTGAGGGRSSGLPSSASELFVTRQGDISSGGYVSTTRDGTRQSGGVTALRSIAQYQAVSALMPTVLGYVGDDERGRGAITASPLRGVTTVLAVRGTAPEVQDRYFGSGLSGLERRIVGVDTLGSGASTLGQAEQARRSQALDQRFAPGDTAYKPIAESLAKAIDQRFGASDAAPVATPSPAAPGDSKPLDPDKPDTRPEWKKALDGLRDDLRGTKPMLAPKPAISPSEGPADAKPAEGTPPKPPVGRDGRPDEVRAKLMESLKSMRTRIETFRAVESTSQSYARHIEIAEQRLSAGEYFAAEGAFSMALIAKPSDATALVGRAHAQIGAGLLVSAAGNLRDLFADHPEMITTRYAPSLFPRSERCEAVAVKIRKELADPASGLGADGGLIIAYMGHQLGKPDWLAEGLKELDARTPETDGPGRKFAALVRELWTAASGDAK